MPDALAGLRVEGHQALGEKVVARAVTAVEVVGRRLNREVDVAELQVRGHRRPDGGVTGVAPRVVFPGLVPELTHEWDGVEDPPPLAGPDVVAAHEPGDVLPAGGKRAQGTANHRDVSHDHRR